MRKAKSYSGNASLVLDPAKTPEEIERRSFEIIDEEIPPPRPFRGDLWKIARRCIHALGDVAIAPSLSLPAFAAASGLAALRRGCAIYTDTRMLASGLVERRMKPLGVRVVPVLGLAGVAEMAARTGCTRTSAGMMLAGPDLEGQIVAIGNAPTALLALLKVLESPSAKPPALIVGMPVGFVNAAQSKRLLAQTSWPAFILHGRKGGSAVAAACLNALADLALARNSSPS